MTFKQLTYHAKVFLFDMDGTLVDSTPVVERTWRRFAERHGLDINQILAQSHGRQTRDTIAAFATENMDISKNTAQFIAEEIADVDGIKAIAGAEELLRALPLNRWAVVTSANRELAVRRMTAAGLPIPEILISAENVERGKPAPDGYLLAARALKVLPQECLVFEDAPVGLASASAACMRAFKVGNHANTSNIHYEHAILDFTQVKLTIPEINSEKMILTL